MENGMFRRLEVPSGGMKALVLLSGRISQLRDFIAILIPTAPDKKGKANNGWTGAES